MVCLPFAYDLLVTTRDSALHALLLRFTTCRDFIRSTTTLCYHRLRSITILFTGCYLLFIIDHYCDLLLLTDTYWYLLLAMVVY